MKSIAVTVTLLFVLAVPLAAQDRTTDLTLWMSQTDVQGTTELGDFATDFESGDGFGASLNVFLTKRISAEFSAFRLSSDATLKLGDVAWSMGSAGMSPLSAGVQYHFAGRSRIDPYIGAGAAYVLGGEMESSDLNGLGVGKVKLGDELTYYANAGIGFHILPSVALVLDGRYIPYEPGSESSLTGAEEDLDLTTVVLSAGLRFRF